MKENGYVLSHTHWDREWYLSFQQFRMRLVKLLDKLIPYLEEHPEFTHFHLDGQTICLEDYLEVRPDMKERLSALVESGRIAVGPWYVLPDLLCIGQESVIRNLNRGQHIARSFGKNTPVGYLPDIFSHTSQMPQIFHDYGFLGAVIWRGVSAEKELPYELLWCSPDGTKLLTLHLPDDRGYLNAFPLADTKQEVAQQFEQWIQERMSLSPSGKLLFMNGCDHQQPNYDLPSYIRYFNETHKDYQLRQVSLETYFGELQPNSDRLMVIKGEQNRTNHSPGRNLNLTLKQTLSSRIPQKLENYACESLLVRYAEPLSALLSAADLPLDLPFLELAWKYLLQNHPHDSICGCSCDDVHRDIERRFSWVREITQQYTSEAMRLLASGTDTSTAEKDQIPVHLFNLLPAPMVNQVQTFTLRLPAGKFFRDIQLEAADGTVIPSQILHLKEDGLVLHPYHKDPAWDNYLLVEVAAQVPYLPAFGWSTLYCRPTDIPNTLPLQAQSIVHTLENPFLCVSIRPNGTLDILDKQQGTFYPGLHIWSDEPDNGDEYVFSPDYVHTVWNSYTHAPSISITTGPLISSATITWKQQRDPSSSTANVFTTTVSLKKCSPLLYFETKISNEERDHRIRLHFPTDMHCCCSYADSHFDIVRHPVQLHQPSKDAWVETESGCYCQKRFVYLEDEHRRMMFLSKGLLEYEIVQGEQGQDLAVTLLRCVGKMGADSSLNTFLPPGPNTVYTQDSQLLGTWEMSYALMFGSPEESVEAWAEAYHTPCAFYQDTQHPAGNLPVHENQSLLQVNTPDFVISAVKALSSHRFLIRGCNLADDEQLVTVSSDFAIQNAWYSNLSEEQGAPIEIRNRQFSFRAAPRKILCFILQI